MSSLASSEGNAETKERSATGEQPVIQRSGIWRACLGFAALFIFAFAIQWKSGAYHTELSHWPDAPSHVINSLLLRDYIAHYMGQNAMHVAEQYYVHYPKVSIGMWPPLYYGIAGVWMLIFGFSTPSTLVLAALTASTLAAIVGWIVSRDFGFGWGVAAGILTLALPQIVFGYCVFILDIPVAVMQLLSMIALVRYLNSRKFIDAVWFGILAMLAMLTKGNAIALALATPILILVTRSWWVFRKPGLYVSTAIIAAVAFPWHLFSLHIYSTTDLIDPTNITNPSSSFGSAWWNKVGGYARLLRYDVGIPLLIPAVVGFILSLTRKAGLVSPKKGAGQRPVPYTTGMGCLTAGSMVFHGLIPIPVDERYMTTTYACIIVFFFTGAWWLAAKIGSLLPWRTEWRAALVAGLSVLGFSVTLFAIPWLPPMGFSQVSDYIQQAGQQHDVLFILSDIEGEGAFVVETAMRDSNRPQRFVVRASKVLSDNTWTPHHYKPVLTRPEDILKVLADLRVHFAVVDLSFTRWTQDRDILLASLRSDPQHWTPVYDTTSPGADRRLMIFRQNLPDYTPIFPMRVNVRHALGRDLVLDH
jgi:Dolichyl-phosphate-mannose-protein mannosyltransferase